MTSSTDSSSGSTQKKPKRSIKSRSVSFSPNVSMRCIYYNGSQDREAEFYRKDEVERIKSRAKAMSRLHKQVRSKINPEAPAPPPASISDATRYEIRGESLRGLEHLTDVTTGRKRRRVQREALLAVEEDQQKQVILHVLESAASLNGSSSDFVSIDQLLDNVVKINTRRLAKAYGDKTQEALSYARAVADEDSKVASKILAEDLTSNWAAGTRCKVKKSNRKCSQTKSGDPSVAAEFIKTLLPKPMSRHRNIVSAQA